MAQGTGLTAFMAVTHHPHHKSAETILGPADPPPFTVSNAHGSGRTFFVCDHASNRIPQALENLGLTPKQLQEHIAWDIGAAPMADILSRRFDAPLIKASYSRLVIDCKRQLSDPTSILEVSDGVMIPGNQNLDRDHAAARAREILAPYHAEIEWQLSRNRSPAFHALISVHSFTPVFQGHVRPWHIGVLWNEDGRLALPFMDALSMRGDVVVGDNEPYSARNNFGYTIDIHGQGRSLPHLLVEVRQDLVADPQGVAHWASIVSDALRKTLDSFSP